MLIFIIRATDMLERKEYKCFLLNNKKMFFELRDRNLMHSMNVLLIFYNSLKFTLEIKQ
jgi:hypothetical protein